MCLSWFHRVERPYKITRCNQIEYLLHSAWMKQGLLKDERDGEKMFMQCLLSYLWEPEETLC